MTIALTILFGLFIGLALGLTGGGGSVFAIPLLVFGLGMNAHDAITLSLAAVTAVAMIGAIAAARHKLVEFRAGGIFAVVGIIAAPLGVQLANQLNDRTLLISFSVLVIIVATTMWIKASRSGGEVSIVRANILDPDPGASGAICKFNPQSARLRLSAPCSMVLAATGLLTGILSGVFGVGGGFIIVPALTFVTQLTIHRAVATSLFVIALVGGAGVITGIVSGRDMPGLVTAVFVAGGVVGLLGGQQVAKRLAGPTLQKSFAIMMVVLGLVTIALKI